MTGNRHTQAPSTQADIERLRAEVGKAATTSERLRCCADFFDGCDGVLESGNRAEQYLVFQEAAFLLSEGVCDAEVWDWLQEKARSASIERQIAMRIAIFELVPDPPIHRAYLFRLWDMWFDPAARWAALAAYRTFPARLPQHLRRYNAHRRRHDLPVVEFNPEEFQRVLRSHGG